MKFASLPGGEFGRGWHCKPLCLPLGSRGLAPEKHPVFTFLHCLKWVFRSAFSSFSNTFWFALMISKWDQEKVKLATYLLWMSSGKGRLEYLNHGEQKYCQIYGLTRMPETRIIRQYRFIQTLYLWYFTKSYPLLYIKIFLLVCSVFIIQ